MDGGWLYGTGSDGLFLALLVCGHVLGDFVFQTRALVRRKRDGAGWLLLHVAIVTVVHGLLLVPFLTRPTAVLVLGIGATHGLIDSVKSGLERRRGAASLNAFAVDQTLHLAVLAGAWLAWARLTDREPLLYLSFDAMDGLTWLAVLVAAYAFNVNGGATVVSGMLRRYDLEPVDTGVVGKGQVSMGRSIGILERMIVLTLVLVGQWGALGLILAAKSIARFKDLEKRVFSEYYLIGTLTSVLLATASGLLVRFLV